MQSITCNQHGIVYRTNSYLHQLIGCHAVLYKHTARAQQPSVPPLQISCSEVTADFASLILLLLKHRKQAGGNESHDARGLHTLVQPADESPAGGFCLRAGIVQHLPAPQQRRACLLMDNRFPRGHIQPLGGQEQRSLINSRTNLRRSTYRGDRKVIPTKREKIKLQTVTRKANWSAWPLNSNLETASQRNTCTAAKRQGSSLAC